LIFCYLKQKGIFYQTKKGKSFKVHLYKCILNYEKSKVHPLTDSELDDIKEDVGRFNRFVEINVMEQVLDLAKTSIVQTAWRREQPLQIHGWVYDVADGLVKDLEVTIENNSQLEEVYKLSI
jgi:carbonic anhydrase